LGLTHVKDYMHNDEHGDIAAVLYSCFKEQLGQVNRN
jgi:hypothetical protein